MFAAILSVALAAPPAPADSPMIGHMVYFTLKDHSPEARQKLVDSCNKLLGDLDGITFFAAGTLPPTAYEPAVNDRDFDVALQVVFADKAAHAAYIKHPKHLKFIADNNAVWTKARVFDSVFPAGKRTGGK